MKISDKMTFILISLYTISIASTCNKEDEKHHKTIRFINNTDKSIYVDGSNSYPDTLNNQLGGVETQPQFFKVYPNTENREALHQRDFWEVEFINIPSDTLMVYVFDADLLEAHTTHVNNTIIQRYDLSLQDLQYVNWTLTYQPSPNMSDIKMYPPYGQ